VNDGKEFIQWSERDGYAHFYLYDENGKLKNQITSGTYHVENIMGIDDAKRVLYFSATAAKLMKILITCMLTALILMAPV
jgi:dipeptidyl-peptidase-4